MILPKGKNITGNFEQRKTFGACCSLNGNFGGGTRMIIDKFKGGIGTSSRKHGEYTVGVLVQSNYGRRDQLAMACVHIGEMLNELLPLCGQRTDNSKEQGSIILVFATGALLLPHQLKRLVRRIPITIGIVGGCGGNNSDDIFKIFRDRSLFLTQIQI